MINQKKADLAFKNCLKSVQNDSRIIGMILGGARSKGVFTKNSDYDVILISTDKDYGQVNSDYPKTEYIDTITHSVSEFREYAKIGTPWQHDRYTYTYNTALIDKSGEIQKLLDEKGTLTLEESQIIAREALGKYFNILHRSLKNLRDGNNVSAHLDAIETIPFLLTFIFAIEGRVRPFNKFLVWELENHPLKKLPIKPTKFINKIQTIITTADFEMQKEVLKIVRNLALKNGLEDKIEQWKRYYFG